jgi:cytochrome c oxidase cbb3-type subunit III
MRVPRCLRVSGRKIIAVAMMCAAGGAASLRPQSEAKRGDISTSATPATVLAGQRIFATTCAACHGLDARGGERAPDILARPEVQRMTDADISRVIREGTRSKAMPAFGTSLDGAHIREVTLYLRSLLQGHSGGAQAPGDPATGKQLFFGKGGCADCHMVNGSGGFMGSDLSSYAESRAAGEVRDAITDPAKNSTMRREKVAAVTTREGQQFTGIARNEDNFSLQLQTPDGVFHLLMKSDLDRIEYPPQPLMPGDYAQRLSAAELNDLVSFLLRTAATNAKSGTRGAGKRNPDDD